VHRIAVNFVATSRRNGMLSGESQRARFRYGDRTPKLRVLTPFQKRAQNHFLGRCLMKLRVLAIVAAGLLIAAGKEGKKAAKDSLIGTWKIESLEQGGKKLDLAQAQEAPSKIMFDDKKITATVKDEEHTVSYTIDATKKPKEIDMTPQDGP